jgi:hypothetical protein
MTAPNKQIGDIEVIWGDLVHLALIQIPRPQTGLVFDVDPQVACATRLRMFDRVAPTGLRWRRPHGFPRLRHDRAQGIGLRVRTGRVTVPAR